MNMDLPQLTQEHRTMAYTGFGEDRVAGDPGVDRRWDTPVGGLTGGDFVIPSSMMGRDIFHA
jgi:hypothetical protein